MIKQIYASITHLDERFDANILKPVDNWLKRYPNINIIARIANHILRAMATLGLMYLLPFSPLVNCVVLFYLTPIDSMDVAGAITLEFSKEALAAMISRAAFQSLGSFAQALGSVSLLTLYMTTTVYISYKAVHNAKE
jgi:hypothetical protein